MKIIGADTTVKTIVLDDFSNGISKKDITKNQGLDLDLVERIIINDRIDRAYEEEEGWEPSGRD